MRNDRGTGICTNRGLRTLSAAEVCFTKGCPSQTVVAKLCGLKQAAGAWSRPAAGRKGPLHGQPLQLSSELSTSAPETSF